MRFRVTSESDTFVYATSPLNFGGLDKEDLFFWMVPMAITHNVTGESLLAFCVGGFCLWLYKRLTYGLPQGHLVLRINLLAGNWERSELAQRVPPLKRLLYWLNKRMAYMWLEKGLLPSPTYCNRYEP
ncbi:hypothetical protein EGJ28_16695 [Stutzerimonas xanthomarina]|jgi:hypothetical protein|uniref:Uncharacterized protein n=1 Tax=Stutzerimonas xanthomarina TaxID=271420 RepID=A0A427DYQ7_9GAMM|nr:hypothetical protein QX25_18790 [Stutzerimonas stutzeri]MBK3920043.1 hypothetical protein [Stutzerimonas frequens]RRV08901.1 hypothetical protein EGJ28_16695 [Stutzerimonas xanthomarina]